MDCSWRRTLASVFLLLSPHNLRVLSQNVGPGGQFPPLPLLNEPWVDYASLGPGQFPQQMNFLPGPPNGILTEFVPYASEYQKIPEYFGPGYPQSLYNPVSLANNGQFTQGPVLNPQINNIPLQQGPAYNAPPNINVLPPQVPLFTPLVPVPLGQTFNVPLVTNISPKQGPSPNILPAPVPIPEGPAFTVPSPNILPTPLVPISQGPVFNIPQPNFFLSPQGLPPLVPISQEQIQSNPTVPIPPITGPAYNIPPITEFPNHNQQVFPLVASSYPQPYFPPTNAPCTLTTDLTSMHLLPPPNVPSSIPIQNYAPTRIPQFSAPSVLYPQLVPADYVPNSVDYSNYPISALPPVFPANVPQLYDNFCGNSHSVAEEYNPVPINLNINVPSPTIPEPKITIITAYPPSPTPPIVPLATSDDKSDVSFEMFPPYSMPPIIIEGRRSKSRSWLPLFLVALFARDGFYNGSCGCCCCCSSGSADIPIPYPIAIPTNNPIILGSSCRSRKVETKSPDKKND